MPLMTPAFIIKFVESKRSATICFDFGLSYSTETGSRPAVFASGFNMLLKLSMFLFIKGVVSLFLSKKSFFPNIIRSGE